MPIYEFYCPDNHTIYQFYAKTLAQGKIVPPCPDNPAYRMEKMLSSFAVTSAGRKGDEPPPVPTAGEGGDSAQEAKMEAAMNAMESEFSQVDENDPKAMGRMMRRMAELSGEKIDGEMEHVVRKLEEGTDPDALEEQLGGEAPCHMPDPYGEGPAVDPSAHAEPKEARQRFRARTLPPRRDAQLYDYP